eukprot:5395733-Pyramimonas_sp.AAC.1
MIKAPWDVSLHDPARSGRAPNSSSTSSSTGYPPSPAPPRAQRLRIHGHVERDDQGAQHEHGSTPAQKV